MNIGDVAKKILSDRSKLNSVDVDHLKRAAKSGDKQMVGRLARVVSTQDGNIDHQDVEPVRKKLAKDYYKQTDDSSIDALEKRAKGKLVDEHGNVTGLKEDRIFDKHGRSSQGKALKNAESTAPANKKIIKPTENAPNLNKKSMGADIAEHSPFSQLERDLPSATRGMKVVGEEALEQEGKRVAKRGLGKLGRMGVAGLAGGAVGLGINALMEGLDAEETGSEEEDFDVAAKRAGEKTTAKLKAEKANSLKASTKKRVTPGLPDNVKKTTVFTPKPRSDASITKGFNEQLDKHFGKEDQPGTSYKAKPMVIEGMDNVEKVMRDEFKGAAKESNKKPISKYLKR